MDALTVDICDGGKQGSSVGAALVTIPSNY